MKEKIITNVLTQVYTKHLAGEQLIAIDLDDLEIVLTEPLHDRIAKLNTRIEYLEMREDDLLGENAVLRTQLIDGNDNKTDLEKDK